MRHLRLAALLALSLAPRVAAHAQTRERLVPFDAAGHVTVITPPLAARLGLVAPVWPVSGDYVDARLYSLDDSARAFVLVVHRRDEVLERSPLDSAARVAIADAVARGERGARLAAGPDSSPTLVSEPVRGRFIFNQAMLGALLFGPATAIALDDPNTSAAAYLLVAGGTFFTAAAITSTMPVSRAQNHLAWHSARRGALAADLALFAIADDGSDRDLAAATLVGGIAGDVIGFQLGRPMTDAEAHGTSHGSTVAAALTGGALGIAGAYDSRGSRRAAAVAILGAGALGYPLGLNYVRTAPYRITAGDVGAMTTAEIVGVGAGATFIPDRASPQATFGLLTAGYVAGALIGDRALMRPFDHTEAESQLLSLGAGAGAVMGLAIPTMTGGGTRTFLGAATAGGALGMLVAETLVAPRRARAGERGGGDSGSASAPRATRVGVQFSPEGLVMAATRQRGSHSLLSLTF